MTIRLKQSTASQEIPLGYFVDSTDGNTEETGLTIANTDIKLWKMGAITLANKNNGGATHISNGIYYCTLDDTDTNTLGALVVFIHVSGALAVRVECEVLAANVYDSLIAASDNLQVDAVQIEGTDATDQLDAHDGNPPSAASIDTLLSTSHGVGLWGGAGGTGSISWPITITVGGLPVDGVDVWVTTDSAGSNTIASGTTNDSGIVTFLLDAGTYYAWKQLAGYSFTNPESFTVS